MRGTSDRKAFRSFVEAVVGFPPSPRDGKTAEQVFQNSYRILSELAELEPEFPRAIGWKAYALALSVYEGWPLPRSPEARFDDRQRLDLAKELAERAVNLDPDDFDVHWALADVCLIRGEFEQVKSEFETALFLNGDERHPNLFAEAASAMMQIGEHEEADKLFRKAERHPDWHRWMRGISLFLRAGRSEANKEFLLDRAIDEFKAAKAQPGEDFYQQELQLMLAAVYWRKQELWQARSEAAGDENERSRSLLNSERFSTMCADSLVRFQGSRRWWDPDRAKRSLSLNPIDQAYWHETVDAIWDWTERRARARRKPRAGSRPNRAKAGRAPSGGRRPQSGQRRGGR